MPFQWTMKVEEALASVVTIQDASLSRPSCFFTFGGNATASDFWDAQAKIAEAAQAISRLVKS